MPAASQARPFATMSESHSAPNVSSSLRQVRARAGARPRGHGPRGACHAARRRWFREELVVKQIRDELASDEDFIRRFVEEAKTTVALAHPNIVPVYELGVELGTYFLAMELVEGASLAELRRACAQSGTMLSRPEEGAYI